MPYKYARRQCTVADTAAIEPIVQSFSQVAGVVAGCKTLVRMPDDMDLVIVVDPDALLASRIPSSPPTWNITTSWKNVLHGHPPKEHEHTDLYSLTYIGVL